jgi:hypothetical protein
LTVAAGSSGMALGTALKYLLAGLLVLFVVSVVASVVLTVVSLVYATLVAVATLLVLGGLAYGGFKLFSLFTDDGPDDRTSTTADGGAGLDVDLGTDDIDLGSGSSNPSANGQSTADRVDRLRERYANGELTEAELERRLELALDGPETDGIDRELERDRR